MILNRTISFGRTNHSRLFTKQKVQTVFNIYNSNQINNYKPIGTMNLFVLSFKLSQLKFNNIPKFSIRNFQNYDINVLLDQCKHYSQFLLSNNKEKLIHKQNIAKFLQINTKISSSIENLQNKQIYLFVSQIAKHRIILQKYPQFINIKTELINQILNKRSKYIHLQQLSKILGKIKKLTYKQWDNTFNKYFFELNFQQFLLQFPSSISLNQLCQMYDAFSFNYKKSTVSQKLTSDQYQIFKQKILSSIKAKIYINEYNVHKILIFLKNYHSQRGNSESYTSKGFQINKTVLQQYNSEKKQITVLSECTSLLEMFTLLQGQISLKQSILHNRIYPFLLKQSKIKRYSQQSSTEGNQIRIIKDIVIEKVNIFMASLTLQNLWNPQLFKLIEDNFFELLLQNQIKNQRDIDIYCDWRGMLCKNLVKNILKQEYNDIDKVNNSSARIQQIKKAHIQFIIKLLSIIKIQYLADYSLASLSSIIGHCKTFKVSSRKINKLVQQIQNLKLQNVE